MHEIEVRNSASEKIDVRVMFDEHKVNECAHSLIILTHKFSNLRLAVLLDTMKHQRALVVIPGNRGTSLKVSDFYMEIYGINNNGKIVIHATKSLGNFDITFPTLIKK